MRSPSKLEFASYMLTYKENLKYLTESIRDLESQVDDSLQQTLLKSSSLVKLNKGIKEIQLLSQALANMKEDKNPKVKQKLLTSFRRELFETQCLLMEEIQKSMLKAAEAMIDAGNAITIMSSFTKIGRILENFEKR